MKTGCPYSVFLISCLLSFVCRAEKLTEFSTVEVKDRQGKKTSYYLACPGKDRPGQVHENQPHDGGYVGGWSNAGQKRRKGGRIRDGYKGNENPLARGRSLSNLQLPRRAPPHHRRDQNSQISRHRKPATLGEGSFAQGFAHSWRPRPEGNRKTQGVRLGVDQADITSWPI